MTEASRISGTAESRSLVHRPGLRSRPVTTALATLVALVAVGALVVTLTRDGQAPSGAAWACSGTTTGVVGFVDLPDGDLEVHVNLRPGQPELLPLAEVEPLVGHRVGHQAFRPEDGVLVLPLTLAGDRETFDVAVIGGRTTRQMEIEVAVC